MFPSRKRGSVKTPTSTEEGEWGASTWAHRAGNLERERRSDSQTDPWKKKGNEAGKPG